MNGSGVTTFRLDADQRYWVRSRRRPQASNSTQIAVAASVHGKFPGLEMAQ